MAKARTAKEVEVKKNVFGSLAKDSLTLSELHNGREQIDTDDILGEELTVVDFDLIETSDATYATFVFDEYPDRYYNGGLILTKMVNTFIEEFGGLDKARDAYASGENGVLRIMLSAGKSAKTKNNLTLVEVLD